MLYTPSISCINCQKQMQSSFYFSTNHGNDNDNDIDHRMTTMSIWVMVVLLTDCVMALACILLMMCM